MQTVDIMKQVVKKKAESQKKTSEGIRVNSSAKIHSTIKIALEKRERERISNLVERELWSRRLAF